MNVVALRNEGNLLPLLTNRPLKIAVIGGYSQAGLWARGQAQ